MSHLRDDSRQAAGLLLGALLLMALLYLFSVYPPGPPLTAPPSTAVREGS